VSAAAQTFENSSHVLDCIIIMSLAVQEFLLKLHADVL
jgi:hypothetical protein